MFVPRHVLAAALVFAAVSTPCPAQREAFTLNDPPQSGSAFSLNPGVDYAFPIYYFPQPVLTISAIQVHLSMAPGTDVNIGIWDVDPVTLRPNRQLAATGSVRSNGSVTGFHGALLSSPVQVYQGGGFFVVLRSSFSSPALTTAGQSQVPFYGRSGGPWVQIGTVGEPSIRVYAGSHAGTVTSFGSGKPGTGSIAPRIESRGWPNTANRIDFDVVDIPSNIGCFFLLGTRTLITIPDATLYVQPLVVLSAPNPSGSASIQLAIPYVSSLAGAMLAAQAVVLDPGGSSGFTHSQGIELTIGH